MTFFTISEKYQSNCQLNQFDNFYLLRKQPISLVMSQFSERMARVLSNLGNFLCGELCYNRTRVLIWNRIGVDSGTAAKTAPRLLRSGGFQLGTRGFQHRFFIIYFAVVKPLQSDFLRFFPGFYRSLIEFIFTSPRKTIVFIIIQASALGVLVGQASRVLVGKCHLIIRVRAVHSHKARLKGNKISGSSLLNLTKCRRWIPA